MGTVPALASQTGAAALGALAGVGSNKIYSARPRESGDPEQEAPNMQPWVPASAGTSGDRFSVDAKAKARSQATDFEAVFLNTMFGQMFTGIDGDGPFGGGGSGGVWRSFLSEEYSKSFAKAGGIGLADHVYRALLTQQEARAA